MRVVKPEIRYEIVLSEDELENIDCVEVVLKELSRAMETNSCNICDFTSRGKYTKEQIDFVQHVLSDLQFPVHIQKI